MKKKVIATLLASTMCMSLLAGCGSTDTDAPASSAPAASSAAPASSSAPEATPEPAPEKIDLGGEVITWLIRDTSVGDDGYSRYHELKTIAILEEELNCDIQFEVLANTDQYLLRLTAGELPDLISWNCWEDYKAKGGFSGYYKDNICIELNDVIDQYMPNLKAIFEANPNVAKDMMNDEGQYLYFQRINPMASISDLAANTSYGLVMRQDWLDNVSLDVPTNIAEWYDVLTAFKTMDPNGNGEADEIPFDASSSGISMMEAGFGMSSQQYVDPDTGKVEYGARSQKYKAFLEEMNKWYSEGLIGNLYNEDGTGVKTNDPGGSDETIAQDLAGSWKGSANNDTNWVPKIVDKNPAAAVVAVPWPATTEGKVYSQRSVSTLQRENTLITTDCKNVEAVAKVVDWMFSERGSELLTWGEEGVTFTYDADGNKVLTEEGAKQIELPNGKKPQVYKMYGNQSSYLPSFSNFDVNLATRDDWYKNASKLWADASFDLCYPQTITLSEEQNARISGDTNTQMFQYISEMRWKFMTGQEPLSNFDTYVAELERMGISEIVAVYQEAYDNYMAR